MQKKIVVSIDPLNYSQNVIDYAVELAKKGDRHLILYSVQGPPVLAEPGGITPGIAPIAEPLPGRMELAETASRELFEKVKASYQDVSYEYGVGFMGSSVLHRLEKMTEEDPSQTNCLLVMAKAHGHNWWNEVVGTAETVVAAESPCPVLFLPEDVQYHGIARVLYLADEESVKNHDYPGFRYLRSFAQNFGATMALGYLGGPDELKQEGIEPAQVMKSLTDRLPMQFSQEFRFFPQHTAEEILQLSELTGTDVIAFPYRDSSIFGRLFDDEITQNLLLKTTIPALVF